MDASAAYEESLKRFTRKRDLLNAKLDAAREKMDSLLNGGHQPSLEMLATLEVLLKERRDLLAELAALDDDYMNELVQYLPVKSR